MSAKTLEINDEFEIMFLSPFHGCLEVWQLTSNVRLSRGGFERPISYGETYLVRVNMGGREWNVPRSGNLSKFGLCNSASVPIVLECLRNFLPIKLALAEGPFVNNGRISRCFE
jgi:hypothetical protein